MATTKVKLVNGDNHGSITSPRRIPRNRLIPDKMVKKKYDPVARKQSPIQGIR
jgi:hypothetical protein